MRNTEVEKGNKTKIKRQIQELVVEDGLWSWSLTWQMMFNPGYILWNPLGLNLRTVDRGAAIKGDTFSRVCVMTERYLETGCRGVPC